MKKGTLFCVDEKDRCEICNKQIYKDMYVTKTKTGYLCEKCRKKSGGKEE